MTRCRAALRRGLAALFGVALLACGELPDRVPGGAPPEPSVAGISDGWTPARPEYAWSFPDDHFAHPGYRTEWWYFTGELGAADEPPRWGWQLTFFRVGVAPDPPALDSAWAAGALVMAHAAVVDLETGERWWSELLWRAVPLLGGFGRGPGEPVAWSRAPAGTDGRWSLFWTGEGFALEAVDRGAGLGLALEATSARPVVLHGENGFSRKGRRPGSASHYATFPRMAVEGTLTLAGERRAVAGEAWMDHEFASSPLDPGQVGWDWFALRLDDGRDVMLYALRSEDGSIDFGTGTLAGPDGTTRDLPLAAWDVEATGAWTSLATGTRYPSGWRVRIPSAELDLGVEPVVPDQENVSALVPDLRYWEGAVEVRDATGRVVGRGWVELTGYGEGARPAL